MNRKLCMLGITAALAWIAPGASPAAAQYPDRPVRIVLPYAPGAAGDIAMRQLQPLLEKTLGQPLIVDYRSGAGGNIGVQEVARASPDGYTLVLGATNNFVINQYLYRKLGFDPLKDLQPIGKVADVPSFIYVSAAVPAANYAEFRQYAQAHPGQLNYGSPGTGTAPHLSAYMLTRAMQAQMTHIPYRGSAPGVQALLANEVQLYLGGYSVGAAYVPQHRIRALAVALPERFAGMPDVPTTREAGIPDVVLSNWWALAAPRGVPQEVMQRWSRALNAALADPGVQKAFLQNGFIPGRSDPAGFERELRQESRKWQAIVKESGITLDD
ncbi:MULTISPECIES: tripartite tricarboxylate transporter substrate binding protein [unclassified Achromobacter]|uniref:Bug family tripartite tricarboxylate transporter substrate binding protein n=1 Tax=unclassified Achromobacter TaxID=2626865 RepID=UPI00069F6DEF|nr:MULTISPECIES: tripartite tricarboxylate transporter substrate binding protein [unclassified Achromobacter]KOF55140.1 ABC transporter substrate-binding protein [Achromobacter sp. DMS1]